MSWPAEIERHHPAGPGAVVRRIRRLGVLRLGLVLQPQRTLTSQDLETLRVLIPALNAELVCTYMGPRHAARALCNGSLELAIACDRLDIADAGLYRIPFSRSDGHAWWAANDRRWCRMLARMHLRLRARALLGRRGDDATRMHRAL